MQWLHAHAPPLLDILFPHAFPQLSLCARQSAFCTRAGTYLGRGTHMIGATWGVLSTPLVGELSLVGQLCTISRAPKQHCMAFLRGRQCALSDVVSWCLA